MGVVIASKTPSIYTLLDWFTLSLISAITLAGADLLTKRDLRNYSGGELLLARLVLPGILLAPLLFIAPVPATSLPFWGWLALLIPLELYALQLYMRAIRDAPLAQTLPYLSFTPVFSILSGWLILGEEISLLGTSGIVLVVFGTYLLNSDRLRQNGRFNWFDPLRAIFHQQGARRMLVVAIIYSVTSVLGKAAMVHVGPLAFGAVYSVALAIATLVIVALRSPKELRVLGRNHRHHFVIGVLMALMVVTHFLAIAQVEAAYMVAVKRLSLLFGIILGAWLLHEKGLVRNLGAASVMVAGVALILLA